MIRHIIKFSAVLFVTMTCLWLDGCYDASEVENLNVVAAIGVDETDNGKVRVTAEIIQPVRQAQAQGDSESDNRFFTVYQFGDTIEDALEKMNMHSPKEMYYPHNTMVVFGKKYAEHGLTRSFDYLERDPDYRRNELLIVTEGTAYDLLQCKFKTQKVNATGIRQLLDRASTTSKAFLTEQLVVMRQYYEPSHTPLLAVVDINRMGMPYVAGMAMVSQGRLKTIMPNPDDYGLLWTIGSTGQIVLTFPMDKQDGPDEQTSIRLLSTRNTCRVVRTQGGYTAFVHVTGHFDLEHISSDTNLNRKLVKALEAHVNQEMKKQITVAVHSLQDSNTDGVFFANHLFQHDPQAWKQIATHWNKEFPKIKLNVNVDMQFLRSNLSGRPPTSVDTPTGSIPPQS